MDQNLQVFQLPVLAQHPRLGVGGLVQCAGQGVHAHGGGNGTQQDLHILRPLVLQGEVAGSPRLEGQLVGADPGLAGVELADSPCMAVDLGGFVQHGVPGVSVQQVCGGHLRSGRKQAPLLGSVLLHHVDSVLQLGQAAPGLGHCGGFAVEQGGVVLVVQVLRRFAHLHAARVLEAVQQGVPVFRQGNEPEPFHLHNGH